METQEAYHQYLITAQQQADYMNTILWILFTIFVIAPISLFIIWLATIYFTAPKCPKCGSKRNRPRIILVEEGNITTTDTVSDCLNCGNRF